MCANGLQEQSEIPESILIDKYADPQGIEWETSFNCRPELLLQEDFAEVAPAMECLHRIFPEVDVGLAVSRQPYFLIGQVDELIEELKQYASYGPCNASLCCSHCFEVPLSQRTFPTDLIKLICWSNTKNFTRGTQ